MDNWNSIWEKMINDDIIKEAYKEAFLLNMFQKMCAKMSSNKKYREDILTLFRQSSDCVNTVKIIVRKAFDFELSDEDGMLMWEWFNAYRHKSTTRKKISQSVKQELYDKQNGVCPLCGQELGKDWSRIHVDHIIPWSLVGDELENNYQDLCGTCNECKNASTDYIFKSLIKMN